MTSSALSHDKRPSLFLVCYLPRDGLMLDLLTSNHLFAGASKPMRLMRHQQLVVALAVMQVSQMRGCLLR